MADEKRSQFRNPNNYALASLFFSVLLGLFLFEPTSDTYFFVAEGTLHSSSFVGPEPLDIALDALSLALIGALLLGAVAWGTVNLSDRIRTSVLVVLLPVIVFGYWMVYWNPRHNLRSDILNVAASELGAGEQSNMRIVTRGDHFAVVCADSGKLDEENFECVDFWMEPEPTVKGSFNASLIEYEDATTFTGASDCQGSATMYCEFD